MLKVGLTGGIASGKTTVAEMFVAMGAALIDTDRIARELVQPGSPTLAAIIERFGAEIVDADGELKRRELRARIFASDSERKDLDRILHPQIRRRVLDRLDELAVDYVIIAVPLLVETGFAELVDCIVVVDCPLERQIERLIERDDIGRDEAVRAISAQASREARLALADYVIDNGQDLVATERQVRSVHRQLMMRATDCRSTQGHAE